MKKLLYYCAAGFLLAGGAVHAQTKIDNLSIDYGQEIPDDSGKIVRVIGEANDHIYTLVSKSDKYLIRIFNSKDMSLVSTNPIVLPEIKDKDVDFEDIFMINSKLFVIGSVYHRKDKVFTLIGVGINEKGILDRDFTTLFESHVANKVYRGDFYFKQSPDKQLLLVMHTAVFEKEDSMKYEIKMFDDNLKQTFTTEDKISYDDSKKDYQFTISDFDLNYKDDVFMVVNEGYRDKKNKEHVEKFQLFTFKNDNGYQKQVSNIDIKGKEIINCSMMATAKNTVQLVGFYSSVRESGRANKELKGIYNATINVADNSTQKLTFNEFDYATKVKLLGKRRADKGKDLKPLYRIHSIIEKNDGGLIVLSEFFQVSFARSGIGPLAISSVIYQTNEVVVTSLNPDGTIAWSNVVPKEQQAAYTTPSISFGMIGSSGAFTVAASAAISLGAMGRGPEYLSIIPIYNNGQLSILFNDNVRNKGITDIEEIRGMGNYNSAVPTLFVFDDKGGFVRKDPEEVVKNQLVIRPGVFCRKNDHEYIIYASRKSKDKLGRMILN